MESDEGRKGKVTRHGPDIATEVGVGETDGQAPWGAEAEMREEEEEDKERKRNTKKWQKTETWTQRWILGKSCCSIQPWDSSLFSILL